MLQIDVGDGLLRLGPKQHRNSANWAYKHHEGDRSTRQISAWTSSALIFHSRWRLQSLGVPVLNEVGNICVDAVWILCGLCVSCVFCVVEGAESVGSVESVDEVYFPHLLGTLPPSIVKS